MSAERATARNDDVIRVVVDDRVVEAYPGETVAAILLVTGAVFRYGRNGSRRAPFCLMGVCQECLVEIDGIANRRACLVPVSEGMTIRSAASR